MTDEELRKVAAFITAHSKRLDSAERVTDLDGVMSLPALKEDDTGKQRLVHAPLAELAKPAVEAADSARIAAEEAKAIIAEWHGIVGTEELVAEALGKMTDIYYHKCDLAKDMGACGIYASEALFDATQRATLMSGNIQLPVPTLATYRVTIEAVPDNNIDNQATVSVEGGDTYLLTENTIFDVETDDFIKLHLNKQTYIRSIMVNSLVPLHMPALLSELVNDKGYLTGEYNTSAETLVLSSDDISITE